MKKFVCSVCGYVYEGTEPPEECPVCHQPASVFREDGEGEKLLQKQDGGTGADGELAYDSATYRNDASCRYMEEIHQMAVTGHSIHAAMGTRMPMPGWDDILLLGAQLNPAPLNDGDFVSATTVIGHNAKRPMILDSPVYISHMQRRVRYSARGARRRLQVHI